MPAAAASITAIHAVSSAAEAVHHASLLSNFDHVGAFQASPTMRAQVLAIDATGSSGVVEGRPVMAGDEEGRL